MSKKVAYSHADWLSLVDSTGSFISIPVLNRAFPSGLEKTQVELRKRVREWLLSGISEDSTRMDWIAWVLKEMLGWGARLRDRDEIDSSMSLLIGQHQTVLRPDFVLIEPQTDSEVPRAFVMVVPSGTGLSSRIPGDVWTATPAERLSLLLRDKDLPLGIVTNGTDWRVVWAPREGAPASAVFTASLFIEEPALLNAFTSLFGAKRFFAAGVENSIEALFRESAAAQEVVADQLGRQVRGASEILIAAMSRANRESGGALLGGCTPTEIYSATITVLMRLVFLLFAEERGLLPLDDDLYARSYALCTLRQQLQEERDLFGDEPLERRNSAWNRLLALFRSVHGGVTHDALRIPPYGGRLFDPDRFPFLEGRQAAEPWRSSEANPIPVDDLSVLEILRQLQILQFTEGGVRESRQLSYRTLEVEQIGHVYEGLLDHSVSIVDDVVLGLVGRAGDEPELPLADIEAKAAGTRKSLLSWLKEQTGKSESTLEKLLDGEVDEADRQLLLAAVENDEALFERVLPWVNLLRPDIRQLPMVMLEGAIYVTQTSLRREGGVEYTTRDLADEVAQYALEPLVYSPGPQDGASPEEWKLRTSDEILDLKICDPAVGSGAILVAAGRYLSERLAEAWLAEGADESIGEPEEVLVNARRAVADRCLYGVDRDPLAAEMAKLSLWLMTMSKDRPFTFLDHSIRSGDSLLGITDLDQARWMHLDPAEGRKLHNNLFDYTAVLEPLVQGALDRRKRLSDIRVITVRDAEDKARLTEEADQDMELLRAVADLVVGATLATCLQKGAATNTRLLAAAEMVNLAVAAPLPERASRVAELRREADQWLNAGTPANSPQRRCLHWPIEFPEVFVESRGGRFDAVVGNPPFVGGTIISSVAGADYRKYVVRNVGRGRKGKADLVAFFLLRASLLARTIGMLATNTLGQGETSETGLGQIRSDGWTITRATRSVPWPGRASLEISKVWFTHQAWSGEINLDGAAVLYGIDESLQEAARSGWRRVPLQENRGVAYLGVNINGLGFTLSEERASELILQDERNSDVVFRYVGGRDLNSHQIPSDSRWIINFAEMSFAEAQTYPECLAIVDREVRTSRLRLPDSKRSVRENWWKYEFSAPTLYSQIASLEQVIALARVSKTLMPVMTDARQVFNEKVVVFSSSDWGLFGVLSCAFHYHWALRWGGTMRSDPVYVPSDCFETFALPPRLDEVADVALRLHHERLATMQKRGIGLTVAYNELHSAQKDYETLRGLHVELNEEVLLAYGWTDINLRHGFYEVRDQGQRFTVCPEASAEVGERLLELNKTRYEAEQASLPSAPAKRAARGRQAPRSDITPTLFETEESNGGE